jgi:hypothetical protein
MICDLDCGARWMTTNSEEITLPQMRESRHRGNPDESPDDGIDSVRTRRKSLPNSAQSTNGNAAQRTKLTLYFGALHFSAGSLRWL